MMLVNVCQHVTQELTFLKSNDNVLHFGNNILRKGLYDITKSLGRQC